MTLSIQIDAHRYVLPEAERQRVQAQLDGLEQRVEHRPGLAAVLGLRQHIDLATKRAVEDIESGPEPQVAEQRGDASYGVPSRGACAHTRPSHLVEPGSP